MKIKNTAIPILFYKKLEKKKLSFILEHRMYQTHE